MEIENRECKEIKIGEHIYWFVEKYKGGEVRKVMELVTDEKIVMKERKLLEKLPELFITLCKRIDADTVPTVAFLDDLGAKDYMEVQNTVTEEVDNLFTQAK